jgi:hypothetical protein
MSPEELTAEFTSLGFGQKGPGHFARDGIEFTIVDGRIHYRDIIITNAEIPAREGLQSTLTGLSPMYRALCELRELLAQTRDIARHTAGQADFARQVNRTLNRAYEEIDALKAELVTAYTVISQLRESDSGSESTK